MLQKAAKWNALIWFLLIFRFKTALNYRISAESCMSCRKSDRLMRKVVYHVKACKFEIINMYNSPSFHRSQRGYFDVNLSISKLNLFCCLYWRSRGFGYSRGVVVALRSSDTNAVFWLHVVSFWKVESFSNPLATLLIKHWPNHQISLRRCLPKFFTSNGFSWN